MPSGPTVVTGAGGFAGRHLVAALTRDEAGDVIAWHRQPPPHPTARTRARGVDILDREAVRRAIAEDRPARVFHLAGAAHLGSSWRNSLPPLQINVLGTHHLLEAVRVAHPECRVLVVTSAMIYQAGVEPLHEEAPLVPSSPYGLSKLAQDQLALMAAREDGLDVVVARPFNHIGPGQDPSFAIASFARQIALIEAGRAAPEIRVGNLDARRDLTDVRDTVRAYQRLMEAAPRGTPFNICSGTAYRIGDLLDHLVGASTVPVRVTPDPERLRPSDMPLLLGDHARITGAFGWQPQLTIAQTLADTLWWWRQEVAAGRVTP